MNRWTLCGGIGAILLSAGVALHEWSYAGDHPYAYGPAKVIAVLAIGGVSLGVAILALAFRVEEQRPEQDRRDLALWQALRAPADDELSTVSPQPLAPQLVPNELEPTDEEIEEYLRDLVTRLLAQRAAQKED